MHWLVFCVDKPNVSELRAELTPAHLKYLDSKEHFIFVSARQDSDDGSQYVGSMFILDVPNKAAAEDFIEGETFYRAGLFQTVIIRRLKRGRFHPELATAAEDRK